MGLQLLMLCKVIFPWNVLPKNSTLTECIKFWGRKAILIINSLSLADKNSSNSLNSLSLSVFVISLHLLETDKLNPIKFTPSTLSYFKHLIPWEHLKLEASGTIYQKKCSKSISSEVCKMAHLANVILSACLVCALHLSSVPTLERHWVLFPQPVKCATFNPQSQNHLNGFVFQDNNHSNPTPFYKHWYHHGNILNYVLNTS